MMTTIILLHAIGVLLVLESQLHFVENQEILSSRSSLFQPGNETDRILHVPDGHYKIINKNLHLHKPGTRVPRSTDNLVIVDDLLEPLPIPSSRITGPYFETNKTSFTVSTRAGQMILLDCAVVLLQGRTVSWLRKRNDSVQLLTVGNTTYSTDARLGLHFRYPNNWRLGIAKVNKRDEGDYECQLSTHPPKTLVFHLRVIAPAVQILDDNEHLVTERHYKVDSSLHLTCRASHLDKSSDNLSWFKGDRLLPGGDSRIKVKTWKNQTNGDAATFLSILSVRMSDSGTYFCKASQAQNSIVVHVLNEKLPAAVQHENSANVLFECHKCFFILPFSLISWV